MGIKLSGMISGLDTDSLVKELMSAYSTKKDKLVKSKIKQEWKMDAWKDMNKSIHTFYTKSLSSMRLSGTYNAKKVTVSDSKVATVSGSTNAVNGTQTLKVTKLAKSGYLTGGKISAEDGSKLTESSKLSSIKGMSDLVGSKININGTDITVTEDMNIGQFVKEMKSAGVGASFDATNQRFFVNAKASGADADFTITGGNSSGVEALKAMGLFTVNDKDKAEYQKLAALDGDPDGALTAYIDDIAGKKYYTVESYTEKLNKENESASAANENLTKSIEANEKEIERLTEQRANDTLTEEDRTAIDEKIAKLNEAIDNSRATIAENETKISDNTALLNNPDALSAKVNEENAKIRQDVEDDITGKIAAAKVALAETASTDTSGTQAVRINGSDAEIWLNGAKYEGKSNTFSINGLTISAQQVTGDEEVTITTDTDVDGVYKQIKSFLTEYNKLVNSMDASYNAASAGDYEPLTDEEKEALSDSEVEKWEKKVKDALLRRDSTLGSVTTAMKNAMAQTFEVGGVKMNLASFGIKTLGYFNAAENEKGAYHIDGDVDDDATSGNADKLKAMIASDPEKTIEFFQKLTTNLYDTLTDKMKGSTMSSAYTVYNDKQMKKDYDSYTKKITDMEEYLSKTEETWYKKFAKMESAMSKLQSQQANFASMLGM